MLRRAAQQLGALQAAPSTSGVGEAAFASLAGRLCTAWGVQGIHSSAAAWAKAPAAGGAAAKKATKKGRSNVVGKFDPNVATGCNILKGGTDPKLGKDEEYPEWLWKLAEPRAILSELEKKGVENLTLKEGLRWAKLSRKKEIKTANQSSGK